MARRPPLSRYLPAAVAVGVLLTSAWLPRPPRGVTAGAFVAVVDTVRAVGGAAVEWTTYPVRRPVRAVASAVRPGRTEATLPGTEDELQEVAEAQRREAAYWKARAEAAEAELEQLGSTAAAAGGGAGGGRVRLVGVNVAAGGGSASRPVLRLDVPLGSGINSGQAVAAQSYLVGRVAEGAGAASADVELVSTEGQRLQAELQSAETEGGGSGGDTSTQWLEWNREAGAFEAVVARSEGVEVGDVARLADPLWPMRSRGLVIGRVEEVVRYPSDPELYDLIRVRPMVELSRLQRVTVLVPMEE